MVTYAVTLSDLIEKGGAYAGLAAFFGFAVLSVLAFAQAREIRRLRDWAGRAPERAQELEQRVVEQAEQARRVVATPSRRPGEPATAAAQGVVAKPAPTVAKPEAKPAPAVAAEDQPTTATPPVTETETETPAEEETATEHAVVAKAPATAAAPEEESPAEKAEEPSAVPVAAAAAPSTASPAATPANGTGEISKLPPRATKGPPTPAPAVKRPAPSPQPLRATQPPSRRPAPAVAAEPERNRRTPVVVAGIAAGLILIVIGLLAIFTGGDDPQPTKKAGTTQQPQDAATTAPTADSGGGKKKPSTAPRADTKVAVLNGTTVAGLASTIDTNLTEAGYTESQTPTNYTDQARSASVVFYSGSENRTAAGEIGKLLDISDVQPIVDAATQLAPGADVVVVVGADQTP